MAIKTIAVDVAVYERLAATKRSGESFSKAIDRLLTTAGPMGTGAAILEQLSSIPPLPDDEAERFVRVIEEDRATADWDVG
jgi:predicted CopG family antitoxin